MSDSTMTVNIPARENHEGFYSVTVVVSNKCPVCNGPRGEPFAGISYDGSRRLACSQWINPCSHVDKYSAVRKEAASNGLNTGKQR